MPRNDHPPVGNVPTGTTGRPRPDGGRAPPADSGGTDGSEDPAADSDGTDEGAAAAANPPDREAVLTALRSVPDPDLDTSVVESGIVADARVDDGAVTVAMSTEGLAPAAAEDLTEAVRGALLSTPGVSEASVVSADEATAAPGGESGPDHQGGPGPTAGEAGGHGNHAGHGAGSHERTELDDVDRVVAVASAKGGVGKSTVTVGLARALAARGADVGVFDADIHGPNVHRLLDAAGPVETTEGGRAAPVEAAGVETMSVGLLAGDEPLGWRGAMAHEALQDLLGDTAWTDRDVLVLDLPPGTGDVVLTTLQSVPVDGVVLVTTPYPTAMADTGRTADLVRDAGVPVFGVVRNMAGFECPDCGGHHDPFGDPAETETPIDAPTLADLPLSAGIREGIRPGSGTSLPAAFRELAESVTDRLGTAVDLPPSALDLRGVPPAPAAEQAVTAFRATDPGEALYLRTDREPRPLLAAIAAATDADGPDALDSAVERRDPSTWAVRIDRPAVPDGGDRP